jgi:acyl carrier protein
MPRYGKWSEEKFREEFEGVLNRELRIPGWRGFDYGDNMINQGADSAALISLIERYERQFDLEISDEDQTGLFDEESEPLTAERLYKFIREKTRERLGLPKTD